MDLDSLERRLAHEGERRGVDVKVLAPSLGGVLDILSLNWDDESKCWVLVVDEESGSE